MSDPWSVPRIGPVEYPESDGEPVGETDLHIDEFIALRQMLKERYRERDDVYVAGNLFLYYEEGNPAAVFAPDSMVIFGVPNRKRRTYKLWDEGRAPSFVLEVSSKKTWLEDTGRKRALCARLGVDELFLFDPEGDYLEPRLQGYRLQAGDYVRIEPHPDGSLVSDVLGLAFSIEGEHIRLTDSRSGKPLLRPEETAEARRDADRARRRADRARRNAERRAEAAEAELAALRARLDAAPDPTDKE